MSEQDTVAAARENGAPSPLSQGPGHGGPARGYSWAPFEEGNPLRFPPGHTASMVHGARSDREIAPRAAEFATGLLEDAASPPHVRTPAFAHAVQAWARAEAMASLLFEWVCQLADADMVALTEARRPPGKAPVELWRSAEAHAANMRGKLGLDPVAYAKIAHDLGIAQRASEDALNRLGETGRAIREKRAAELEGGGTGADAA